MASPPPPPHPCRSRADRLYCRRITPSEERQVGHSEGIMRPLMLALGATLFAGAPALITLDDPVLLTIFALLVLAALVGSLFIGGLLRRIWAQYEQRAIETRWEERERLLDTGRSVAPWPKTREWRSRSASTQLSRRRRPWPACSISWPEINRSYSRFCAGTLLGGSRGCHRDSHGPKAGCAAMRDRGARPAPQLERQRRSPRDRFHPCPSAGVHSLRVPAVGDDLYPGVQPPVLNAIAPLLHLQPLERAPADVGQRNSARTR
jgi:hypothetical protein